MGASAPGFLGLNGEAGVPESGGRRMGGVEQCLADVENLVAEPLERAIDRHDRCWSVPMVQDRSRETPGPDLPFTVGDGEPATAGPGEFVTQADPSRSPSGQ